MRVSVRVLVVSGNGTNCERETAYACQLGGADVVDVVPIWDLLAGEALLGDYHLLCLPGGFQDGDDLGAAQAGAVRWRHAQVRGGERRLAADLGRFVAEGGLVLGICNGFQLMAKLGLVPAARQGEALLGAPSTPTSPAEALPEGAPLPPQQVALGANASGRFEDRWVTLQVDPDSPCLFTRGLTELTLPVRHGEGRVVFSSAAVREAVDQAHLAPLRYVDSHGTPTEQYPDNPNGSPGGIAGLCDPTGRCFGLMPHPEAFLHRTNHPRWTRLPDLPEEGAGVALFRSAVQAIREANG
jgi:Phosphoribosylformylglycinamidine (FGAM) synthase, glutamine amidotransferase domain